MNALQHLALENWLIQNLLLAISAALLDHLLPEKYRFFTVIKHPVVWMGQMIIVTEKRLNTLPYPYFKGCLSLAIWLSITTGLTVLYLILLSLVPFWIGFISQISLASWMLCQHSLIHHVKAVAIALSDKDPEQAIKLGQAAVSQIVGREPHTLDQAGICRASLESLAENSSDGVIAPLFWLMILGLPGLMGYKMINTADSMVGYLSNNYRAYGWASAKLDDLVNLIPARLTGLSYCLAASWQYHLSQGLYAVRIMERDAHLHKSPNAGWPEAAMAAALNLALAGPRTYHFGVTTDPFMHPEGAKHAKITDIIEGLVLFRKVCWIWIGAMGLLLIGLLLYQSFFSFAKTFKFF